MPSSLYDRIYAVVATIPKGQVASYGSVAQAAGMLRGARLVGWALRQLPINRTDVPWQRVVAQTGRISIINPRIAPSQQAELLESEGIKVVERAGELIISNPDWFIFPLSTSAQNS